MLSKVLVPSPELAVEIEEARHSCCSSKELHSVLLTGAAKSC